MWVILLKDIKGLGKKYERKNIQDGYARNYLIPREYVELATKENLEQLKIKKEKEKTKAEEELKKTGDIASALDGQEVELKMRTGEEGQFFEKINEQKISKKLKEIGFNVDKSQIEFTQEIEGLGEFPVKIKFRDNLEVEIKLIISNEEIN